MLFNIRIHAVDTDPEKSCIAKVSVDAPKITDKAVADAMGAALADAQKKRPAAREASKADSSVPAR